MPMLRRKERVTADLIGHLYRVSFFYMFMTSVDSDKKAKQEINIHRQQLQAPSFNLQVKALYLLW